MLEIKNIQAEYYKGFPILNDISFTLEEGGRLAIMGRNGAGKTSLLNCIYGLLPLSGGEIRYRGKMLSGVKPERMMQSGLGYFMQGAPVFPQLSVKENLRVSSGKISLSDFNENFHELTGLFPLLQSKAVAESAAGSLSGGERTQLALAMSILMKPGLLLLDEPFAGLSPSNAGLVFDILNTLHEEHQVSIILVAQDRGLAASFCNRHYVIRSGMLFRED